MIITQDPYTQEKLEAYQPLSNEALDDVLIASQSAFQHWKKVPLHDRIAFIEKVILHMTGHLESYAQLITSEMGKPIQECRAEIEKCIWLCKYYTEATPAFLEGQEEVFADKHVLHTLAPVGTVFGIMPWNYPFWQAFRYAIPNLLAGNTILLKHAPNTTGCGIAMEKLFAEYAPLPNLFKTLIIEIEQVEHVIAHQGVQGVCLTGSLNAGKAVGALAGKYIKKSVLELGSSDALAILSSGDLDKGLDAAFASRMINAGQTCIAAKRLFIPQSSLEYAVGYLKQQVRRIQLGDPKQEGTGMGPISKGEFVTQLASQVSSARQQGSTIHYGASAQEQFFLPGIMTSDPSNPINDEEVFGPVLNLIPYDEEDQLLDMINDSNYGLGASIWCDDESKAIQFAKQVEVGSVVINDFMKSDPRIPFGGVKQSGYGREMGKAGFVTFQNEKSIILPTN